MDARLTEIEKLLAEKKFQVDFKADFEKKAVILTPRAVRRFYERKVPLRAMLRDSVGWMVQEALSEKARVKVKKKVRKARASLVRRVVNTL